jgi:hypothetical protein
MADPNFAVEREDSPAGGRCVVRRGDGAEGEMS